MTRRCVIQGRRVCSLADLYETLGRQLGFPDHFGANLDALYDVLTGDVPGPIEIVWRDHGTSAAMLGADYGRVLAVLRDAAAARGDLTLVFD